MASSSSSSSTTLHPPPPLHPTTPSNSPSENSGSPPGSDNDDTPPADGSSLVDAPKKKKKKKKRAKKLPKLSEEEKEEQMIKAAELLALEEKKQRNRPSNKPKPQSVLCISRNKHWRHISAYHGPWLQLPVELLESLLSLNLDPISLQSVPARNIHGIPSKLLTGGSGKERDKGPTPPPIDPGVFRSVINIRRLVDEASDLAVRASSGLSAFNLSSMSSQSLQVDLPPNKNGREPSMSAIRTHRLRALACQRLAEAYKWDEIAASVMVMQGASALDDLAEKVLRIDPTNPDALYVHFFHEKIPSRMVAENTTTDVLDSLINAHPHRLEFYRTRGIVKVFLDQYAAGARDFTHALVEARAARKGRQHHSREEARANGKKKGKASASNSSTALVTTSGGVHMEEIEAIPRQPNSFDLGNEKPQQHSSVGPEAPLPIEPQCLFLRGSSYLMHAVWLIESAALKLEEVGRTPPGDGMELRLCNLSHGRFGGIEIGNPDGPLGSKFGKKLNAYREVFGTDKWKTDVHALARKSIRDHERFLAHFDQMESLAIHFDQTTLEELRNDPLQRGPRNPHLDFSGPDGKPASQTFTTYHPLLVESHYSILLDYLLLGDFPAVLNSYVKIAHLVDGLEGYPVFLPARSMAQAEFVEVFERLLGGWRFGATPDVNAPGTRMIMPPVEASKLPSPYPSGSSPSPLTPSSSATSSSFDNIPGRSSSPPSGSGSGGGFSHNTVHINGNGSASAVAGGSRSSSPQLASSGRVTPSSSSFPNASSFTNGNNSAPPGNRRDAPPPIDLVKSLDAVRQLIVKAGIKAKEREAKTAEKVAEAKRQGKPASFGSINIPLSGPRVEVILVWLASVVLPELEDLKAV